MLETGYWLLFLTTVVLVGGAFRKAALNAGLNVQKTIIGYGAIMAMWTVYTCLLSAVIGWLAFQRKSLPPKVLLAWNILGLVFLTIVVSIFLSMLANPGAWGYEAPPIGKEFGTVPFLFLPAFLMPSAVFMHLMSMLKIKRA